MIITFSMLLERTAHLLGAAPSAVFCTEEGAVRAVSQYENQTAFHEDTLYVCAGTPPAAPCARHLFCIAQSCSAPAGGNIAYFPAAVQAKALTAAAQEALSGLIRWGDRILEMIYTDQGLEAIVDFAYGAFKNPMLIYDSSLKVLAYTRNDGSSDRMWRDTVNKGTASSMTAEEASELLRYVNRLDHSPRPFKHTAKDLTDPFYNGNILLGGRRVGMVDLMEHNHTITPGEIDLLQAFCYLLSFELQKDAIRGESRGIVYHQLIADLLEGSIEDASALRTRLTATRWTPTAFSRVVCFQPVNEYMTKGEMQQAFEHLLTLSIGRCVLREREIMLLLSCKTPPLQADSLQILGSYCSAHQLRCGVSDAYDNLLDTHLFAPQAALALTLSDAQVVLFGDVRFENLLRVCRAQRSPSELLHPVVMKLAEYDRQHGSDYLPTLEALLTAQFNQMLAARALHIHRTTLIYRLQRISEMTGLALDDAREMLHIHLSLCICKGSFPVLQGDCAR